MSSRVAVRIVLLLSLCCPAAFAAPTTEECRQALSKLRELEKDDDCSDLAAQVYTTVKDRLTKQTAQVPPRAVQPIIQLGDASGAGAQSSAVPSGFPTPQAGGNVGVVGTRDGPRMVAALSVNPLSVATSSTKELAWASRTADVSLVVPVQTSQAQGGATRDAFDYIGIHAKVNALGIASGDAVYGAVVDAYKAYAEQSTALSQAIEAALNGASDVGACSTALINADDLTASAACGGSISLSAIREADVAFRAKLAAATWEADRQYFGLDARAEFGDPTFSGDASRRGTTMVATLAAGRRLGDRSRYLMLRAKAGVAYSSLDNSQTAFSFDGGIAAELGSLTDVQAIRASVGIDGRKTSKSAGLVDTNYADLHVDLSVPFATGAGLTIGFSTPLGSSTHGAMLTLSGDWSLLLPAGRVR